MQPGKPLTEQELAELERLADEATPGPWFIDQETGMIYSADGYLIDQDMTAEDILFICAANPQTVLGLIAEICKRDKIIDALSDSVTTAQNSINQLIDKFVPQPSASIDEAPVTGVTPAEVAENRLINAARSALDFLTRYFDGVESYGARVRISELRRALAPFDPEVPASQDAADLPEPCGDSQCPVCRLYLD